MSQLEIKPSHKPIKQYYAALEEFEKQGVVKETSVRAAFQEVLTTYARKRGWSFVAEATVTLANKNKGSVDGAAFDSMNLVMGHWEAKDVNDDLEKEIKKKFAISYPQKNIIFWQPERAAIYQDGVLIDQYDLKQPSQLVRCLEDFFVYRKEEEENWKEVAGEFKKRIPDSAKKLIEMIEVEKKTNKNFQAAFASFAELCRASINPNLADAAIEEMLVQHLLTSRLFASVFDKPEFVQTNVIAREIENVISALASASFNRKQFFAPLDHFYVRLENRAKSITDWSEKQEFINTVYEKFFQGFTVKVADTHGIVYTPQPIVDFMVRSVQHILKTEFDRSLADEGVHILDPFVGTGNFIMHIIEFRNIAPFEYRRMMYISSEPLLFLRVLR